MRIDITRLVSAAALLFASLPAMALQSLDVDPGSAGTAVRLEVPPVSIDASGLPARATFRDLFGGRRPTVSFSPSSFNVTWRPECQNEQNPATSPQGRFRASGSTLAVDGTSLSTMGGSCPNGINSVPETVTLPDALGNRVVHAVLDARVPREPGGLTQEGLRAALERTAGAAVSDLRYQRAWQVAASGTGPKTEEVDIRLDSEVAGRIVLNLSRLVAFNGSSTTDSASVLGASRPVPITWTGTVEQIGSGSPLTLRSDRFVVRTRSGAVVGQGTRPLTRSGIRSGRATFNETIRLTSSQLLRARRAGGGLILERTLSDNLGNSFTARVPVNLTGPSQADFAVSAMKCHFHDGSRVKIVQEGDPVHVVCDLRFDGPGGLLRGTWEAAEGGGNQLFFRPLQLYSNFVVGQNRIQVSRTFTARGTGRHVVRFRVQEPELLVDQTSVQYYVGVSPEQVGAADLPSPVSLLSPAPNSVTEAGLEVSWSGLPAGTTHVLVEFFTSDQLIQEPNPNELEQRSSSLLVQGEPRAGLVVPADRSSTEVTRLTMDHLRGAERLYMRVSALEDGVMVGVSPLRRLNAP